MLRFALRFVVAVVFKTENVVHSTTDVHLPIMNNRRLLFLNLFRGFRQELQPAPRAKVAVFMGSPSDLEHGQKVKSTLQELGIPCDLRVTSAHKGTDETLSMLAEYEGSSEGADEQSSIYS